MTDVSGLAQIEADGVEAFAMSSAAVPGLLLRLLLMYLVTDVRLDFHFVLLPRASFDAKAAFVTAIVALHAIAKHDSTRSTIPHSCVMCRRLCPFVLCSLTWKKGPR
jgi:hypothetical protein